jgi:hypothetical protein
MGTPVGLGNAGVFLMQALGTQPLGTFFTGAGTQFWAAAGGAQAVDTGVAVPSFDSDIVLRGGIARIHVMNPEDDVPMRVKIYGVWAASRPSAAVYTAVHNQNRSLEWDPSIEADFHEFGKVLFVKEAMLANINETIECVYKFKPQKIDQHEHLGSATQPSGNQLWWMVTIAPLTTNVISDLAPFVKSFNLSFVGDAES